jgi:hypothetical protein
MSANDQQLPPGVQVAGNLNEQEAQSLNNLQREQRNILMKMGELEVQKARLLGRHAQLEQQGQVLLQGVATRLEIPSNWPWQVQADGSVLTQEPPAPEEPEVPSNVVPLTAAEGDPQPPDVS